MMVVLVVAGTTVFVAGQAANHVSASSEPSAQVTIARSGISPETVSIKVGQSVTWTNTDAQSHRLELVNTGSGVPAIGFGGDEAVGRGETYSYAFSRAGTYTYTDATNPGQVRGFVIVKP
jgi:plastocyanin